MKFFNNEMLRFDIISTNVVARPIDIPFSALVVVARVGQQPNNNTKIGFSFINPLVNVFQLLIVSSFQKLAFVGDESIYSLADGLSNSP